MRKLIIILFILFTSCEDECTCFYVTYESNPQNNYKWTETYRSSWDVTCGDELLDSSVYTDSDGKKWYTDTYIECE